MEKFFRGLKEKNPEIVYPILVGLWQAATGWFATSYALFITLKYGLNFWQFNLLNVSYLLTDFVFEIPTGALADHFGRKRMYFLGQALFTFSLFFYFSSSTFLGFLIAEVISGLGTAFIKGSLESWLYEEVGEEKKKAIRTFVHGRALFLLTIPTGILGAWVANDWGLEWPFFFAGLSMIFSMIVTFRFMKTDRSRVKLTLEFVKAYLQTIKEGLIQSRKNKILWQIFWLSLFSLFLYQSANLYWAIIFEGLLGSQSLTWIWPLMSLSFGLSGYALYLRPNPASLRNVHLWYLVSGLAIAMGVLLGQPIALLGFFIIHEIGRGLLAPLVFAVLNKEITENKIRATINSVMAMAATLGAVLGLLVGAVLSLKFSPLTIWFLSAIPLSAYCLFLMRKDIALKLYG